MLQSEVVQFFTQNKQIWFSENFLNILINKYSISHSAKPIPSIKSADLKNFNNELNSQLIFVDPDQLLVEIITLISSQLNGEEGELLNDSSANYFFIQAKDHQYYSVLIRYEQAQKLWRCGLYLQQELKIPNLKIFYPK